MNVKGWLVIVKPAVKIAFRVVKHAEMVIFRKMKSRLMNRSQRRCDSLAQVSQIPSVILQYSINENSQFKLKLMSGHP